MDMGYGQTGYRVRARTWGTDTGYRLVRAWGTGTDTGRGNRPGYGHGCDYGKPYFKVQLLWSFLLSNPSNVS